VNLPRLTTRHLLVLVALVGLALGSVAWMQRRAASFRGVAAHHRSRIILVGPPSSLFDLTVYHMEMAQKYERAARYPWLLVEPDPPEPMP
jgi:hypothetical protein